MSTPSAFLSTPIADLNDAIAYLRQLTQKSVQDGWRGWLGDLPAVTATSGEIWSGWQQMSLNSRHHIAWNRGKQVLWLGQRLVVPAKLNGYPLDGLVLRLALTWWAEAAQIFVNGTLVQDGDLFDCSTRILLTSSAQPGDRFDVAIRLVSPGHDDGALVLSRCIYENQFPEGDRCPEPGFVADELAVLQTYMTALAPEQLEPLVQVVSRLDRTVLTGIESPQTVRRAFEQSMMAMRHQLQPWGDWLKRRKVRLLGHAHLDLAWLWPIAETWEAAERTFKSVLQLQQDVPDLLFCHSTPALYAWVEEHRPALFDAIRAQIATGRWEVVAGLWVEPELNLVSGESIIRQVFYGQRYVLEKFGRLSAIAWLPDTFGFCWQLPQILKRGGVDYFVTQKLRWNDTTLFPHELFWWRSPDGTQILSFMSPRIGEGIDPVRMANYASQLEAQTQIPTALWLPGVGDHGGGPTRDMLDVAKRWQQSPLFPSLDFTTAQKYLEELESLHRASDQHSSLPVWEDELYLEFHRGCYTTHADQKQWNRQCEVLLYQAELFSSLATLLTGLAYPQSAIEAAWKGVLFNQFHDILPGSSIPDVFDEANQIWRQSKQTAEHILKTALEAIASAIELPPPPVPNGQPIVIFNALTWERSEVVSIPLPDQGDLQSWQVYDLSGHRLPCQQSATEAGPVLLVRAESVPGVGYCVVWLGEGDRDPFPPESAIVDAEWMLENDLLRVVIDPTTGTLSHLFDKQQQREVLRAPGNQLQAFQDDGQYWDAWNIDPKYADHPLPAPRLVSIQWLERGPIRQCVRVVRQLGTSEFCQDYVVDVGSSQLKIKTQVNWQERHVLVKAAFPLTISAEDATYEIPCGAIQRPTQPSTPAEQAKWEVPALQWADLGDRDYGVSLLNDCKYGYDSQPSQLRLTLLRGSDWPHPGADLGHHQFTYAVYPHAGAWQSAGTVRQGYELNQPLQVWSGPVGLNQYPRSAETGLNGQLPAIASLLTWPVPNLILSAFKRADDDPGRWILRVYESQGQPAILPLDNHMGWVGKRLNLEQTKRVNLLEQPDPGSPDPKVQPNASLDPWQIATFAIYEKRRSQ